MAKDFAKPFYNSKRWQKCKQAYISQRILADGGMCEECRKEPGLIVHHKVMLTELNIDNPDVSLNHENLEYVCKECHDGFEGHGVGNAKVKPLFAFDSDGQPISLREVDSPCAGPRKILTKDRQRTLI
jgi:5-methylcytosine-specific restriction endonuclease McrA